MPHAIFVHFDPLSTDEAAHLASQLHISHPHLPCVAVGRTKYPQCMLAALRAGVQDFLDVDAPVQTALQTVRELIKRMPAPQSSAPSAPLTAILSARAGLGSSLLVSHLAWYLQKRLHGRIEGKEISASEISNETLDGLLIDLGNPSGDCSLYMGTQSDFDFIEAVNNLRRFDRRLASTGLSRHESGLRMLTLPRQSSRLRDVSYADVDALLAALKLKAQLLAFVQRTHAGALDRRDVHEHILAAVIRLDEAEALLGVEPLNCSDCHSMLSIGTATRTVQAELLLH